MTKFHILSKLPAEQQQEIITSLISEFQKLNIHCKVMKTDIKRTNEVLYVEGIKKPYSHHEKTFSILLSDSELLNECHFCNDVNQLFFSEYPIKACIVSDNNSLLTYVATYQFNFSPMCFVHIHNKHNYSMLAEYLLKL